MFKRLMSVMLVALMIVAVASVGGVAEADEPVPPPSTPEDDLVQVRQSASEDGSYGGGTDGDSDGMMFMVSDSGVAKTADNAGAAMQIQPNPWGCRIKAHNPHESSRTPGRGYVQAKADIYCVTAPPAHIAVITQDLSRRSGSQMVIEAVKTSSCPSGTGEPDCYPSLDNNGILMKSYISAICETGVKYRWVHLADARMYVEGVAYSGLSARSANVKCKGPGR